MTPATHKTHWLAVALAVVLGGCGYHQNGDFKMAEDKGYQWHSLYREDITTVAVPIFQNRDFRRGLEFRLSKAVVNQLEAKTPYKVVSREHADTVLEGEIVSSNAATLSRSYNNNVPQEQLMILVVNFQWKDLRTGRILLERKNFQQTATYYPTLGEGEFVGSQQSIEKAALAIVQELQADW